MGKKVLWGVLGGILGCIAGLLAGGFLGLVIGGTFLGGLDIYQRTGIEGYELAAYAGGLLGLLAMTPLGVVLALRIAAKAKAKA